jgi:hypothetical protein
VIGNAVRWAAPVAATVYSTQTCPNSPLGWFK